VYVHACRRESVDWKALRCSLHKARSVDSPNVDTSQHAQALMQVSVAGTPIALRTSLQLAVQKQAFVCGLVDRHVAQDTDVCAECKC